MKDIENELKEKYDEVEVPSYMFDTSRVFKRVEEEKKQRNKRIISIAASIVIILIIAATIIFAMPKLLKEDEIVDNNNSINTIKLKSVDILNKESFMYNKQIVDVITIKVDKIEDYCFIDNVPYTIISARVIKSYLGNIDNQIKAYIPGGIFKVKDLKENIKEEIEDIDSYTDEELVEVTYHKAIFIPMAEENKTYITTLKEVNGEYFVDIDKTYGFKEYDPETNIVKYDTGDEQLEIDKYLENINI